MLHLFMLKKGSRPAMNDSQKSKSQILTEMKELKARLRRLHEVELIHDRMEMALQKSEEALRILVNKMVTLVEITHELALAPTIDMLCLRAVELGCDRLGFERIGIWLKAEISNHENCGWLTAPIPDEVLRENKIMNLQEIETGIELANKYSECIISVAVGNEMLVEEIPQ